MTNKEKILRYLECGLKVKAVHKSWKASWTVCYNDGNKLLSIDDSDDSIMFCEETKFDECIITPIPTKPNYQPGDLVTILPIEREVNGYENMPQELKDMVDSGVYHIKFCNSLIAIYNQDKSDYWWFPTWAIAPAFPDDAQTGEKAEKLKELEARMEQIQKEIEALKN